MSSGHRRVLLALVLVSLLVLATGPLSLGACGGPFGSEAWRHDQERGRDHADDLPEADGGEEGEDVEAADESVIADIVAHMSLDEKIAQMIIPAIRSWDGADVTTLPDGLAAALRAHQYGGVVLFGANMATAPQTAELVSALQANNAQAGASHTVPYLVCADGEGGLVVRLASGTRMTGSMAIGATGAHAVANAWDTGRVLGEELAAVGVDVDFAPDADVNSNPANPVIGTRAFSDDAQLVASLASAFGQGLAQGGVIGAYKHFPGHGDTGVDSHTGLASVDKTYDQLKMSDLVPFREAIRDGAELVMTAHIALPLYDEAVTLRDGSEGYYPATMSHKIISEMLRDDMGYDGVVITDALEMGAIMSAGLVPGDDGSVEYAINVAEKIINADVDVLLIPTDLTNQRAADFYDAYIAGIADRVRSGAIDETTIDRSVTRILRLKQRHGILDEDPTEPVDAAAADKAVGSDEHRETELRIAREAITLLRNDGQVLPLSGREARIVIVGRDDTDAPTIVYALEQLQKAGLLPEDAYIDNLVSGTSSGSRTSATSVTIDYYYDIPNFDVHYRAELRDAIGKADTVVVLTKNYGVASMGRDHPQYRGASQIIADAHTAGVPVVVLSNNLPYDAARYQQAEAIVLTYMSAGLADPTDSTGRLIAYNANVVAGIGALFGNVPPVGTLPVDIPQVVEAEDGSVSYSSKMLYQRGDGLRYDMGERPRTTFAVTGSDTDAAADGDGTAARSAKP